MHKPSWAVNQQKYIRAKGTVKTDDESLIKAEYIRIGGLTREEVEDAEPTEEVTEVPKKKLKKA